jgi:hypothetical protein
MITTLNGSDVTVSISDGNVYIDDAMVTMADIETDNGVIHVIDAVLLPATSVNERIIEAVDVTIYPNPASDFVNVRYQVVEPAEIKLEMYDIIGQRVHFQDEGYAYEGTYDVEMPLQGLESGMYILIINTGKSQIANSVRIME